MDYFRYLVIYLRMEARFMQLWGYVYKK